MKGRQPNTMKGRASAAAYKRATDDRHFWLVLPLREFQADVIQAAHGLASVFGSRRQGVLTALASASPRIASAVEMARWSGGVQSIKRQPLL